MRPFTQRRPRVIRVACFHAVAGMLLLAGGVGSKSGGASQQIQPSTQPTAGPEAKPSHVQEPSAAALVQRVYDSFGWIDTVHSFRIRTEYSFAPTAERLRRETKHPTRNPFAAEEPEPRTFSVDGDWAWDQGRIHHSSENHYVGDPKSTYGRQARVWNGSLAIEFGERADHTNQGYVLDNKFNLIFNEQDTTLQLMLPWGPGGPHHFWWLPTDVGAYRSATGVLPDDFKFVGKETINGKACSLVESWVGDYRFAIGEADGRLYRRTWLLPDGRAAGYDPKAIYQKVAGPTVKTYQQFTKWCQALEPQQRNRAAHQVRVAEAEFVRKKTVAFHHFFDDYREVIPGRWLPFRQRVIQYNRRAPEPFVESHLEQRVTEVSVDRPLPNELFQIELRDGVEVRTDWRYDPPIHYRYSKSQTEAERIALRDFERKKRVR
jgi:hypothetical protein